MRIVVIGASGTIGREVVRALSDRHKVVSIGHSSGDPRVDISSQESIRRLYEAVAPFDAVVSAAGQLRFNPLESLTDDDFQYCLSNKLMGQINLVRLGVSYINDNGSFTLTNGILAKTPLPGNVTASMVDSALEGFARTAAVEMPRGVRVNVVSPPWIWDEPPAGIKDPSIGMTAVACAAAYVECVESSRNGETLDARDF